MMVPSSDEALYELCGFARVACEADLVLALEVDADCRAKPVASSPPHRFASFDLGQSSIFDHAWSSLPLAADGFRLPTAVVHALSEVPVSLLFVPARVEHAPKSGLLLLWTDHPTPGPLVPHVPLIASSVAHTLLARREAIRQVAMRDQFNDLLESVPSGIIVFDGDGHSATINGRAAELLNFRPGSHRASDLAVFMRTLRERCHNRAELDLAYAEHVGNVDYSATLHWDLGERIYEVDTHPVSGDGQHGRIWLFTDVTAELKMAATLRGLAQSDPLTGLPNRRHFRDQSVQVIASAQATGRVVTVLMVDIDHFKRINDTYGHPVGDAVLKVVAQRCREVLRERDLFARFGGEEFIALLATATPDEVPVIAERVRSAVASFPIPVGDLSVYVSASVGAAIAPSTVSGDEDVLAALIAKADTALYRAKREGRNRVVVTEA